MKFIQKIFIGIFSLSLSYGLLAMEQPAFSAGNEPVFSQKFIERLEDAFQKTRQYESLAQAERIRSSKKNEELADLWANKQVIATKTRVDLSKHIDQYRKLSDEYRENTEDARSIEESFRKVDAAIKKLLEIPGQDANRSQALDEYEVQRKKLSERYKENTEATRSIENQVQKITAEIQKMEGLIDAFKSELENIKVEPPKNIDIKAATKDFNDLTNISFTKTGFASRARQIKRLLDLNRLAENIINSATERASFALPEGEQESFKKNVQSAIRKMLNLKTSVSESAIVTNATDAALDPFYKMIEKTDIVYVSGEAKESIINYELEILNQNYTKVLNSIKTLSDILSDEVMGGEVRLPETLDIGNLTKIADQEKANIAAQERAKKARIAALPKEDFYGKISIEDLP